MKKHTIMKKIFIPTISALIPKGLSGLLKPALLMLVLVVISSQIAAQPVFQKRDQTSTPTGNPVTLTHDLNAITADNLYTVVGVSVRSRNVDGTLTAGEEVTTVTFQGEPMTLIGLVTDQGDAKTYIFGYAEPDKVNGSVSVTFNNNIDNSNNAAVIGAMTFSNVDLSNPYNTFVSNSGNSNTTTLSVNAIAPANSVVFSVVATNEKDITNPSGEYWNVSYGKVRGAGRYQAASGNPTAVSWTVGSDNKHWSIAAVSLNAVPNADLKITKEVGDSLPYAGQTITFTLTATNETVGVDAPNVVVSDLLPAGYTYVSSTPSGSTTYDVGSGVWSIGTLNNSASATLTITVIAKSSGPYTNTAVISGSVTDPTPGNDSASAKIRICQAGGAKPLFNN